ncbi:MAG: antibiotic biosynthesis monooxygenase [Verrucomicrobiae bacterium]|nr:antibiotic biosynthesis monooxygenase [Verrucomicrobiae bacterium]
MNSTALVTIHPYFKAHPGKRDAVRALLPAFVQRTASESGCRYYEFTLQDDVVFCREGYVSGAAALAHLENVGELLQQLLGVSDLIRLELHGPAAELECLRAPLGPFQPAWFLWECGLQR